MNPTTLATALHAALAGDPRLVKRMDVHLADFANEISDVDAWRLSVTRQDLLDALGADGLKALDDASRSTWIAALDAAGGPLDTSRAATRAMIEGILGAEAPRVLAACTEKATRAEVWAAGGAPAPGEVLARPWTGRISHDMVGAALNAHDLPARLARDAASPGVTYRRQPDGSFRDKAGQPRPAALDAEA